MTIDSSIHQENAIPVGQVFDVDSRTGFMPPQPPIRRLPATWEEWEAMLDAAIAGGFKCGDAADLTEEDAERSESWRAQVRKMPVLPVNGALTSCPLLLRRGHLVLTFLLHYYVQTLPVDVSILIPRSIAIPVLRVSNVLDIPPLLTFSDTVLYNWEYKTAPSSANPDGGVEAPQLDNLRSQTTFSGLADEEEFYLCSARIELRGVEALELMRQTMDEMFVGDEIAVRRISAYLKTMASVINELKTLLLDVRKQCDPERYYSLVRPWFRGEDSDLKKRKWVFEGVEDEQDLSPPRELSGPSAGQSSIVHVLDVFLGVDHQSKNSNKPSFMSRMLTYMPRNHRLFLKHLSANPRPLRSFIVSAQDEELLDSYNKAVLALKEFRDAHMIIATLYIIGPARRAARAAMAGAAQIDSGAEPTPPGKAGEPLKGTGGTDLVKFLKDTRNRTGATMIS
ncbi:Indoleamine 2,3-dioxygenase [Ephemerocybe angulata]|uniref:Indoleamine 2,3-dioxygenase n=1 Tax=Ephemerocybe angulata TaxID=980116 RepID=A0A8H6HZR9_9AGAR|nr:Indoleamine 2,3-dioxygenase [Tulosesus angulatus]